MRGFLVVIVLLSLATVARAQEPDGASPEADADTPQAEANPDATEDDSIGSRFSGFPVIGYTPETSMLFGGGLVYHYAAGDNTDDARKSSVGGTLIFTLKGQFLVELGTTTYLDGETWRVEGGVSGARFPNTLYASGPDSTVDSAEDFTERQFGLEVGATRLVVGRLRAGAVSFVGHSAITETEDGGLLDSGELGADGGFLVGFAPTIVWDDRDNDFAPRRGGTYGVTAMWFPEAVGDYGFSIVTARARHYHSFGPRHVLAAELYAELGVGDLPFQAMPKLGGQNRMRGFFQGRYRDKHMASAQLEYRVHLWRRFGGVLFGSVGDVAPSLDAFELGSLEYAGGGGIRFALNPTERVNIRLDIGASSDGDKNLYISLGEAF